MSRWVMGVDGCRGGWLVVSRPLAEPGNASARLAATFAEVLDVGRDAAAIAVDMPIGLPERGSIGGRPCDVGARADLGDRQSAVFAVPSRAAVMRGDYGDACRVALETSDPPRKVSKQTFNLFPKIREVDAVMTPELQRRVVESHPERVFWALNGQRPLALPKKVKSRPYPPGLELRRGLLTAAGYAASLLAGPAFAGAGPDDLLDAAAMSWTAARLARGEAQRLPPAPPLDARGLRMEICW